MDILAFIKQLKPDLELNSFQKKLLEELKDKKPIPAIFIDWTRPHPDNPDIQEYVKKLPSESEFKKLFLNEWKPEEQ